MRAAAGEAETVALLECPAFGIHGEFHFAGEYEARFFAVMGIEFVAGAAAGLHVDEKQIETPFRPGRTKQLLGDAGAPQVQFRTLAFPNANALRSILDPLT